MEEEAPIIYGLDFQVFFTKRSLANNEWTNFCSRLGRYAPNMEKPKWFVFWLERSLWNQKIQSIVLNMMKNLFWWANLFTLTHLERYGKQMPILTKQI